MSVEMYQPCPCGSGKKLKFCCSTVFNEMQKIIRQMENEQTVMAMQGLDRLLQAHPDSAWPLVSRISIMMRSGRLEEAEQSLLVLSSHHPEHPLGLGFTAILKLALGGYGNARAEISEAFFRCPQKCPDLLCTLAASISHLMSVSGEPMAARHFMTLAIRYATNERRQDLFRALIEIENDSETPYPLRSVHPLLPVTEPEDAVAPASRANRLAEAGCVGQAAALYAGLTEKHPDNVTLWQNRGFCHAWDADAPAAIDAFRRASKLHSDFSHAVELETIAQLLELNAAEGTIGVCNTRFQVESTARLLSSIDQSQQAIRMPRSGDDDQDAEHTSGGKPPVATYTLLDRPQFPLTEETPLDDIPRLMAMAFVFDRPSDQPDSKSQVHIVATEGQASNAAVQLIHEVAGDQLEPVIAEDGETGIVSYAVPEMLIFDSRTFVSPFAPFALQQRARSEFVKQLTEDVWPNTPLLGLGGKSPREAVGNPDLKLPLTAAAYVFDAHCAMRRIPLVVDAVCRSLQIEPLPPREVTGDTPLQMLSSMQLHRIDVSQLTDKQLYATIRRAMLIHHPDFLRRVIEEALGRASFGDMSERASLCDPMISIANSQFELETALRWVRKAMEYVRALPDHFQPLLELDIKELYIRLQNPADPELQTHVRKLAAHYAPKIHGFRQMLAPALQQRGLPEAWLDPVPGPAVGAGSITSGGIWSPESPAASGEGKKLWLPGS